MPQELEEIVETALARIQHHPFLRDSMNGTATIDQIHRWIFCAGRESRTFPTILKGVLDWATNPVVCSIVSSNLNDELGNGDPNEAHYLHYLRLLDEMSIDRARFDDYREGPGISAALHLAGYFSTCKNEKLAVGYLLINEAMTPCIYGAVQACLRARDALPNTKFFELHVDGDIIHVAQLYAAIESYGNDHRDLIDGISLGERGMAVLLDEAYGTLAANPGVTAKG